MDDLAIGIDLGTTYCRMAVYRNGNVEIISNDNSNNNTPCYVHIIDKDNFVVAAKELALKYPTQSVYDVKRLIGRGFNDPLVQKDIEIWPFKVCEDKDTQSPTIIVNEKPYVPEQISASVLEYLKKCAEDRLDCPVTKAVITVPAYFNASQRHATKLAGVMAGLEVLTLLHEPNAAAMFYCDKNKTFKKEQTLLVFDLGGRTLDVVIMTIKDGNIQIKAIGGDSHLGGEHIDRNLVAISYLTEGNPGNCARFLEHHGITLYLNGLEAVPNKLDVQRASMFSLRNVAEVKPLRPQLMSSVLINTFDDSLNFTEDKVRYDAIEILMQLLSDGVTVWTIKSPRRADVLSVIRGVIKLWEDQSLYYYNSSFGQLLRLLSITETTECQLWAAWNLKNLTRDIHCFILRILCKIAHRFVPRLVKEGGLDILNTMRCEDEEVRKYVKITLKQSYGFLAESIKI